MFLILDALDITRRVQYGQQIQFNSIQFNSIQSARGPTGIFDRGWNFKEGCLYPIKQGVQYGRQIQYNTSSRVKLFVTRRREKDIRRAFTGGTFQ